LLYNVIISSSKPGDLVLDPFFGTGTTGAVAKATGRNYVGFEMDEKYIKYAQDRLDKIEPIIDDISGLKLEVKPPKVPMTKLIEFDYIHPGQKLYNKDKSKEVVITASGYVNDGEEELSIHKMSAKLLGLTNNNGWDYFWLENNNKELITLDSLRYKYQEEVKL